MIKVYLKSCGNDHASQHTAAYELLFGAAEKYHGIKASEKDILIAEKGKPYFAEIPISFSISHCKGLAVCAVCSADEGEVGVDCERLRSFRAAVSGRVFTESERALINSSSNKEQCAVTLWTLKESYVKYTGTGLAGHTKDIEFSLKDGKVLSDKKDLSFYTCTVEGIYTVSLCCKCGAEYRVIFGN